jgi:hypothetical protein
MTHRTHFIDIVEDSYCINPGTVRIRLWAHCFVEITDFPCDRIPAAVRSTTNCVCDHCNVILKDFANTILEWVYIDDPASVKPLPESNFDWRSLPIEIKNFILNVKANLRATALEIRNGPREKHSERSRLWSSIILGENPSPLTLPEFADVHLRLAAIYYGNLLASERIDQIEQMSELVSNERPLDVLQMDLIRRIGALHDVRAIRALSIYACSDFESVRRAAMNELSMLLSTLSVSDLSSSFPAATRNDDER